MEVALRPDCRFLSSIKHSWLLSFCRTSCSSFSGIPSILALLPPFNFSAECKPDPKYQKLYLSLSTRARSRLKGAQVRAASFK